MATNRIRNILKLKIEFLITRRVRVSNAISIRTELLWHEDLMGKKGVSCIVCEEKKKKEYMSWRNFPLFRCNKFEDKQKLKNKRVIWKSTHIHVSEIPGCSCSVNSYFTKDPLSLMKSLVTQHMVCGEHQAL